MEERKKQKKNARKLLILSSSVFISSLLIFFHLQYVTISLDTTNSPILNEIWSMLFSCLMDFFSYVIATFFIFVVISFSFWIFPQKKSSMNLSKIILKKDEYTGKYIHENHLITMIGLIESSIIIFFFCLPIRIFSYILTSLPENKDFKEYFISILNEAKELPDEKQTIFWTIIGILAILIISIFCYTTKSGFSFLAETPLSVDIREMLVEAAKINLENNLFQEKSPIDKTLQGQGDFKMTNKRDKTTPQTDNNFMPKKNTPIKLNLYQILLIAIPCGFIGLGITLLKCYKFLGLGMIVSSSLFLFILIFTKYPNR